MSRAGKLFLWAALLGLLLAGRSGLAGVEGSISGVVLGSDGKPAASADIQVLDQAGKSLDHAVSDSQGNFHFYSLPFGDYQIKAQAGDGSQESLQLHLASGDEERLSLALQPKSAEMEAPGYTVSARRKLLSASSSSRTEINSTQIDQLPGGNSVALPKLLAATNPGMIQGPFGQLFTRGNHANLQYQIDGVQLPDSISGTFGDAFSPGDIAGMEVITGGIPAEYGNRMAGVVNIITKSGPSTPGGSLDLNYGSFNQTSPSLNYGGSNSSGSLHVFVSAGYNQTDRGLDTPQPESEGNQAQGGRDVVHDFSQGNNEFSKIDWMLGNLDRLTLVLFNEQKSFEIPNYPSSFKSTDPFFSDPGFSDAWGNPNFGWSPSNTGDSQSEANDYAELVWKRRFSDSSWLQLAPYWKYSAVLFQNDPAQDLASFGQPGQSPSSFYENRHVNNAGIKGDYALSPDERSQVKLGFQLQASQASGPVSVQVDPSLAPDEDNGVDKGYQESAYVQDDIRIGAALVLSAGLRYDATQFVFADANSFDDMFQPRLGLSAMLGNDTKLHAFYGRLFQPAPAEDLRDTFNSVGEGQLTPYDIKAEKDDFYELGIGQQLAGQALNLNVYYKNAVNMLDDTQLLNTAISQPYNFAAGYAYGVELSVAGKVGEEVSDFLNYSYEIAEGQGINGGIFAFPTGTDLGGDYQYLDHVQIHTANAGLTWARGGFWVTGSGLYGSGLRTGPDNSLSLPSHLSFDFTAGYAFSSDSWFGNWKLSADLLNAFDDAYPITVANGFNGSHYAAGRELMLHLSKAL